MRILKVSESEAGGRLDKFLKRYLFGAPQSFVYKMLRKKNIRLNGGKAEPSSLLGCGDEITLFLSDETIDGFRKGAAKEAPLLEKENARPALSSFCSIVYEDDQLLVVSKRAGVLTQQSKAGEYTLNEALLDYVKSRGSGEGSGLHTSFRPSVMNRLDRNTTGLVTFAKTPACARLLASMLRERSLKKYYLAAVSGTVDGPAVREAWLSKDEKSNRAVLCPAPCEGGAHIRTAYRPLGSEGGNTLLQVDLMTGRTHQIRAHLAFLGHPVLGDPKYGDSAALRRLRSIYGIHAQMLHSYELCFPERCEAPLEHLSGKVLSAPVPPNFQKLFPHMKL